MNQFIFVTVLSAELMEMIVLDSSEAWIGMFVNLLLAMINTITIGLNHIASLKQDNTV